MRATAESIMVTGEDIMMAEEDIMTIAVNIMVTGDWRGQNDDCREHNSGGLFGKNALFILEFSFFAW